MKQARDVFGRLIIFVDRERASPDVEKRAKAVASEVYFSDAAAFFQSDFAAMVKACESDWVLYLDHDEELSPEWAGQEWRSVLGNPHFTHFFFARRWVLPTGNYIAANPWFPDLQSRLFRSNAPTAYPTKPHQPVVVPGAAALLRHLSIHHHIWLLDREARRQKTELYDSLSPGGALEYYYHYEDFHPRETPLSPPARFDPHKDVITMERLTPESAAGLVVTADDIPDTTPRGRLFWSSVTLHNRTGVALSSAPLFPIRLSYHWRDKATGAVEIFDGLRSEIIDPIEPEEKREMEIVVSPPSRPGSFILEVTAVQEHNFWFDGVVPGFGRRLEIDVV